MTNETQKAPRRYEKMRDSGVEWIGMVPSHWEIVRARAHFRQTNERGNQTPILLAASQKFGVCPQDQLEGVVKVSAGTDLQQFKTVHRNDFIISLRSFQGGFELSPFEGVCSPAYQVFRADDAYDVKYLRFLFKDERFIDHINSLTVGIRDGKNIKYSDFSNSLIILPPLNEQRAIAKSLSQVSAKIDTLIDEVKAGIEEYTAWKASIIYEAVTKGLDPTAEMKDSGVEWIGEIPAAWSTCALKRLTVKIGSGKTPLGGAETYTSHGVLFLRSQNIYDTGLRLDNASYISPEVNESMKNTQVKPGDVLLNITGGSIGRCCVYDLDGIVANVNQHVCIIRTKQEILRPQYLRYFWNSAAGPMVISQCQTGGNRPGLNFEQIGSVKIPLCDIASQDSIIKYLDSKTHDIDSLIQEKQSLISDLESYKKSLIYEVVTGKRKVI